MFLMRHIENIQYFGKEDLHINITSKLVFHNPIVSIIIINFIIFKPISFVYSDILVENKLYFVEQSHLSVPKWSSKVPFNV